MTHTCKQGLLGPFTESLCQTNDVTHCSITTVVKLCSSLLFILGNKNFQVESCRRSRSCLPRRN